MRILFSVHGYKPAWRIGGPVISVSALAETLVQFGHEVTVFTTNSNLDQDLDVPTDRFIDVEGVSVRYFERLEPIKRYFPKFKYFSQSIGTLYTPDMTRQLDLMAPKFDLFHTHMPFVYPTFATAKSAFRHRIPLFYHQRGVLDPERLKFRAVKKIAYLNLIEKPILRKATGLIALTAAERQSYADLGVTTPCSIIPNGINLPNTDDVIDFTSLAERFNIRPDHKVILFMGRLHPIKGADRLLQAFLQIAGSDDKLILVLAGPDEFGLQRQFSEISGASEFSGRVIFPGMVSGILKTALLYRANLFVLPSSSEGFSMAILEALAHETAVIASPQCYFPELASAGAGRIVVPTASALAHAILDLCSRPAELIGMGRAGRALVASRYTWRSITSQMLEVYSEGLDRFKFFKKF